MAVLPAGIGESSFVVCNHVGSVVALQNPLEIRNDGCAVEVTVLTAELTVDVLTLLVAAFLVWWAGVDLFLIATFILSLLPLATTSSVFLGLC